MLPARYPVCGPGAERESWTPPLLVAGLFVALELATSMVFEPWLYGRRVGVSETATLVMVAFWTWLWGPVGLILAMPLTVCLVLLGKYVPPSASSTRCSATGRRSSPVSRTTSGCSRKTGMRRRRLRFAT